MDLVLKIILAIAMAYEGLASDFVTKKFFCSLGTEKTGEIINVLSNITISDCARFCLMEHECIGYNLYGQEPKTAMVDHFERAKCVLLKTWEQNSTGLYLTRFCEKNLLCPPGYELRSGRKSCYKFVLSPILNYTDTHLQCQTDGGHVVVPETPEENEWLAEESTNKGVFEAVYLGGYTSDSGEFIWSTTTEPPEYDAWGIDVDRNSSSFKVMRLHFSSKAWSIGNGDVSRNYVCEMEGF